MEVEMLEFKDWCNLLNLHGAIDNTHISILKNIYIEFFCIIPYENIDL